MHIDAGGTTVLPARRSGGLGFDDHQEPRESGFDG